MKLNANVQNHLKYNKLRRLLAKSVLYTVCGVVMTTVAHNFRLSAMEEKQFEPKEGGYVTMPQVLSEKKKVYYSMEKADAAKGEVIEIPPKDLKYEKDDYVVVFIPDFGTSSEAMKPLQKDLARDYLNDKNKTKKNLKCLRYDRPGYGNSDVADNDRLISQQVRELAALLQETEVVEKGDVARAIAALAPPTLQQQQAAAQAAQAAQARAQHAPNPSNTPAVAPTLPSPTDVIPTTSTAPQKKKLILVGHGFGSWIARAFRDYHPDLVGGMVLVDPVHEKYHLLSEDWRKDLQMTQGKISSREVFTQLGIMEVLLQIPQYPVYSKYLKHFENIQEYPKLAEVLNYHIRKGGFWRSYWKEVYALIPSAKFVHEAKKKARQADPATRDFYIAVVHTGNEKDTGREVYVTAESIDKVSPYKDLLSLSSSAEQAENLVEVPTLNHYNVLHSKQLRDTILKAVSKVQEKI